MPFSRLAVLLPCYSIESLDLFQKEEDAEQLLSAWSALWHPALVAAARTIPSWIPAGSAPQGSSEYLLILPDAAESMLPSGWLDEAEAAGACVLRNLPNRDAMLAAALERMNHRTQGDGPIFDGTKIGTVPLDAELVGDFLALGFCHFQVEMLTRKLRYMSNLDETSLRKTTLEAADAAVKGDGETAREHLQSAFDRLHEAREYFYTSDARLLDLTLVAPTTLGPALAAQLAGRSAQNLMISGESLDEMARREPATLEALVKALDGGTAALIGGEYSEIELPMLDAESISGHLRRGLAVYQRHLGRRPVVFGRRRFGLTPALPQILAQTGFTAAFHCTLDDGRFPTSKGSRFKWEGIDGTRIESIGSLPVDAGRAETFLQLPEKLSNLMNLDPSSTLIFAHWPGRASRWYDDLRRIEAYGGVLGKFITFTEYFDQTAYSGQRNSYKPDEYRSPYLRQEASAGRRDPISRWVRYYSRSARRQVAQSLQTLATLSKTAASPGAEKSPEGNSLDTLIEGALAAADDATSTLDDRLDREIREPLAELARSIAGRSESDRRGCLIVNPWGFSHTATSGNASGGVPPLSIDVPGMGFAWIDPENQSPPAPVVRRGWFGRLHTVEPPPLGAENVLRNEFFEVHFDPHTGEIKKISDYESRNPRLAMQLALRMPRGGDPGANANYSIMAADELKVTSSGPVLGEMFCRGRLLDHDGSLVAGFRQTTRVWRGSRILEILIDLDENCRRPDADPWDSYYAARFAWKDEAAEVHRSVGKADFPTTLTQFESPYYVDIRSDAKHTTLLTAGLPYHRRFGPRKLDTLLVACGETTRSFRLGIAIDPPHPMSAALGFLAPPPILPDQPMPSSVSGWLFHFDCRNVQTVHWEPLPAAEGVATENGPQARQKTGFRVRLCETDGISTRLGLRCLRSVAAARRLDPSGETLYKLDFEGDRVDVSIGAYQWIELEVEFQ